MLMLVSYDVSTVNAAGRRRLRRIAKACQDRGVRVQNSVFECNVDPAQWVQLKAKLESIFEPETDSLRYYNLGDNYTRRIEHVGAKPSIDVEEPLVL
ncbi:MAG: CRISPR-associated endonuclease Cas2 [Kiritimatiellae bacterium]|nr:CRISPR-associated endonuclease Cas2 [Kiritimatiellia bacterium]